MKAIIGLIAILILLALLLIGVFFSWSMYKTMKAVPQEKRRFPAWFCWMMLIPALGVIFEWIMLPYGIPSTLRSQLAENTEAVNKSNDLFGFGLAKAILTTIPLFSSLLSAPLALLAIPPLTLTVHGISALMGPVAFAIWLIYWRKVVKFRRAYL